MNPKVFSRWFLLAALIATVNGDALEFGRTLAISLTRAFSNAPQIQNMPLGSRGTYTGAASHTVGQGVNLQTCIGASANECLAGRGQPSPLIMTTPNASNIATGSYVTTVYVLLQPAFGLPAPGVQASYSLDLRLLSNGADVDSRSLKPEPMIVQMNFKSLDCPTSHVAIGLSGDCGVQCMMYDSRLAKWSSIGVTTRIVGDGVVNCSLSTLPAQILVSQFLSQIRIAMVVDKSTNVVQTFFNSSLIDQLSRWSGAPSSAFRVEALRSFSPSRLDMTRVFVVINSTSQDPESIFQAIKRLPEGGQIKPDPGAAWTQGPLTILMAEKYYTEVPPNMADIGGTAKCFAQSDCPAGTYCDEFSNCFSCGPGSITPGYCDSITYDCCSSDFRTQCTNNPYNCSDGGSSPALSAPSSSSSALAPSSPRVVLPSSPSSPSSSLFPILSPPSSIFAQQPSARGRFTASPTTIAPSAQTNAPSTSPPTATRGLAPSSPPSATTPTAAAAVSTVTGGRRSKNGTLFRIVSMQSQPLGPLNDSLLLTADRALANIDPEPANNNLTTLSLQSQGLTLTTTGEILSTKAPLAVYDELVQQGANPLSAFRQEPLFSQIASIRMLCGNGLWRPRCTSDTLEGAINATLYSPSNESLSAPELRANLETASGVSERFVITDINGSFANFSIVPPEQGEPSAESIYALVHQRLLQRKTITVTTNYTNLDPEDLPAVQSALCSLANTRTGMRSTSPELCQNMSSVNADASLQQRFVFAGPISIPLTPAMVVDDERTRAALQAANNGTELNQSDVTVAVRDSPLMLLPQEACPPPFVRLANGICSNPRGVVLPTHESSDLSLLAKILIGVFVGLAICALLALCFCCWKHMCCFREKDKEKRKPVPEKEKEEPVTNIAFIDQTPNKTDARATAAAERKPPTNDTLNNPINRKPLQPEISPLHRSSFSHHPISLDEHEGASRDGFEYDSRSSDEGPESERRSFHFRLEPKPTPPAITPFKLNSPSSGAMSPSDTTVVSIASPYPPFGGAQSPHPQRRVPPQPRTQPLPQHMLRARKESADLKHSTEPVPRSQVTPKGLQPSQRQNAQLQTPSYARPKAYQQTLQSQQQTLQLPRRVADQTPVSSRRVMEQTPISSMAFSSPGDITDDDLNDTREYSDENTTHHGLSRSEEGL